MIIGMDEAPAITATAASGVSKMANRGMMAANGKRWSPKAGVVYALKFKCLSATDLFDLVHSLLAAAWINEIAKFCQLFQIDFHICLDHADEIMSILELVFILTMKTD